MRETGPTQTSNFYAVTTDRGEYLLGFVDDVDVVAEVLYVNIPALVLGDAVKELQLGEGRDS